MQALIMLVQIYAKYKRCSYKYMQSTIFFDKIDVGTLFYTLVSIFCGKLFLAHFLQTFLGNVLQNLPLCVIAKGVTKQE